MRLLLCGCLGFRERPNLFTTKAENRADAPAYLRGSVYNQMMTPMSNDAIRQHLQEACTRPMLATEWTPVLKEENHST